MEWKKKGIVWVPDGTLGWARTHAMGPTPFLLNDDVIRVFVTCLDEAGRGRPGYIDVSASDPTRVIAVGEDALLDLGRPGCFDDNGVMVLSVVRVDDSTLYMYYAGFELCKHIRYRILTGLAISRDNGQTFVRHSECPILERTDRELFFRGGPYVLRDEGVFKLWYVAGSEWLELEGKPMPVYDLRYQTSADGIHWRPEGTLSMAITGEDEHGFGRPWIVRRAPDDYQLFYSVRRLSHKAYRLGYAESVNGVEWSRKDDEMGLDITPGDFDGNAIMYSAVITVHEKTWCFYNGDNFGLDGIAVAELVA